MDEQEWAPVRQALTEAQRRVREAAETIIWRLRDAAHGVGPAEVRIAAIHQIETEALAARDEALRRADAAEAEVKRLGGLDGSTTMPRHLGVALRAATRAFEDGDSAALRTVAEEIQPLVDAAMSRIGAAEAEVKRLRVDLNRLESILRFDTPYPVHDVLTRLADAAEHALTAHGCDRHGWETDKAAAESARMIVRALVDYVPPDPQSTEAPTIKHTNGGDLTFAELVIACENIGYDLNCGACAGVFYTGSAFGEPHTCRAHRSFVSTDTHNSCVAELESKNAELQSKINELYARLEQAQYARWSLTP